MYFMAAVFHEDNGKSVDQLLEPYGSDYNKIIDITRDEAIGLAPLMNIGICDSSFLKGKSNDYCLGYYTAMHMVKYPGDDEIIIGDNGDIYRIDKDNIHWDSYTYGSELIDEFYDILELKSTGKFVNSAKLKDINLRITNPKLYAKYTDRWERVFKGNNGAKKEELREFGTVENYSTYFSSIVCGDVILPNGKWENFNCSIRSNVYETKEMVIEFHDRFLRNRFNPETTTLTLVDCHI